MHAMVTCSWTLEVRGGGNFRQSASGEKFIGEIKMFVNDCKRNILRSL
jgi:hypothetical protein